MDPDDEIMDYAFNSSKDFYKETDEMIKRYSFIIYNSGVITIPTFVCGDVLFVLN